MRFPPVAFFLRSSLIEWEGELSAVACLQGCNLRCPMCHSHRFLRVCEPEARADAEEIVSHVLSSDGFLDGLVVSGGEPTIHAGLPEFLGLFRENGIRVKLDTNGTNPRLLRSLIDESLADYVAMDLKAPLDGAYSTAAGKELDPGVIRQSIALLKEGRVEYEFRTTVVPALLGLEGLRRMGEAVSGAERWFLQQFEPADCLDPEFRKVEPYAPEKLREFAKEVGGHVRSCRVRGELADYGSG